MPPRPDLLAFCRRGLDSLPLPRGWEAELYASAGHFVETGWAEGRPEDSRWGEDGGMALRLIRAGRQGFASTNRLHPTEVDELWQRARETLAYSPLDRHRRLPACAGKSGARRLRERRRRFQTPAEVRVRLAGWEKSLLRGDRRLKKVIRMSLRESISRFAVTNTRGVAASEEGGVASFMVEAMGAAGRDVQTAWDGREARHLADLDAPAVGRTVRERLLASFGARSLPTGRWPVVFEPQVGTEILGVIARAFCGDAVARGRSFAGRRLGRVLGSRLVTLVDDPRHPAAVQQLNHDEEGSPARRRVIVAAGRLGDHLHDVRSATEAGRRQAGSGRRSSYRSPPAPDISNFYLAPGSEAPAALTRDLPRVFVVREALGVHMADPISGQFSIGASGVWLSRGRPRGAVNGVTVAGDFTGLLRGVDAVANDLRWYGGVGAPSFRVAALSVSGS